MAVKLVREASEAVAPSPASSPDCELLAGTVQIPVRLANLPPLNVIANQVITLTSNPNGDLKQIADVMEGDPAFAADVLFLANSSLFGFRSKIKVVRHAIAVLGLERIKAIAVTAAIRSYLKKGGQLLTRCWQHSVACGIIAEEISPVFNVKGDVAYTLGLLHDIGRLGLLRSYPVEYPPLLKGSFQSMEEVLGAERTQLKVDHALAGAWMVKSWSFPQVFVQTCRRHHEPIDASDSGLLQAVKVSCQLAEAIGHATVNYANLAGYDDVIQGLPPHIDRRAFPSREALCGNVEFRLKSFNIKAR